MGRATEFIDFLNRKDLTGADNYSHLEIREENQDGKMVLKKRLVEARTKWIKKQKK